MVNEEQLLEAYYSTLKYYEKKLASVKNDYERMRLLKKCSELDVKIYDLEYELGKI